MVYVFLPFFFVFVFTFHNIFVFICSIFSFPPQQYLFDCIGMCCLLCLLLFVLFDKYLCKLVYGASISHIYSVCGIILTIKPFSHSFIRSFIHLFCHSFSFIHSITFTCLLLTATQYIHWVSKGNGHYKKIYIKKLPLFLRNIDRAIMD